MMKGTVTNRFNCSTATTPITTVRTNIVSLKILPVLNHFAMISVTVRSQEVRCCFGVMGTCDVWVSLAVRAFLSVMRLCGLLVIMGQCGISSCTVEYCCHGVQVPIVMAVKGIVFSSSLAN